MSEIKIGQRLIDPLQGAVKVLGADLDGKVTLLIERTGATCYRPLHKVLEYKKAPIKRRTIKVIRRVIVMAGTIGAFGLVAALAAIIYIKVRML